MALGYTEEIVTKVAPARIFEAGAIDMHNLAPKILPDIVAGAKILEGDGGVGSIKQIDFTEGSESVLKELHIPISIQKIGNVFV